MGSRLVESAANSIWDVRTNSSIALYQTQFHMKRLRKASILYPQPSSLSYVKFVESVVSKQIIKNRPAMRACSYCVLVAGERRAIARQHTILYNRAKSTKFVGC